jgi:hypothetical protein
MCGSTLPYSTRLCALFTDLMTVPGSTTAEVAARTALEDLLLSPGIGPPRNSSWTCARLAQAILAPPSRRAAADSPAASGPRTRLHEAVVAAGAAAGEVAAAPAPLRVDAFAGIVRTAALVSLPPVAVIAATEAATAVSAPLRAGAFTGNGLADALFAVQSEQHALRSSVLRLDAIAASPSDPSASAGPGPEFWVTAAAETAALSARFETCAAAQASLGDNLQAAWEQIVDMREDIGSDDSQGPTHDRLQSLEQRVRESDALISTVQRGLSALTYRHGVVTQSLQAQMGTLSPSGAATGGCASSLPSSGFHVGVLTSDHGPSGGMPVADIVPIVAASFGGRATVILPVQRTMRLQSDVAAVAMRDTPSSPSPTPEWPAISAGSADLAAAGSMSTAPAGAPCPESWSSGGGVAPGCSLSPGPPSPAAVESNYSVVSQVVAESGGASASARGAPRPVLKSAGGGGESPASARPSTAAGLPDAPRAHVALPRADAMDVSAAPGLTPVGYVPPCPVYSMSGGGGPGPDSSAPPAGAPGCPARVSTIGG